MTPFRAGRVRGSTTTRDRLNPLLAGAVGRLLTWRVGSLALRALRRYLSINGTERALVLAAQCFSALIPMLIVISSFFSAEGGSKIADNLSKRFDLSGNAADAVRTLFARPPDVTQSVTLGGALLLVVSGLSLARSVQRTYEAAWQLPARGLRGTFGGVAALALLLTQILLLSLLAGFLRAVPAGSFLILVARAAASSAVWLALQYLLLGGRVPWRRLLPGAVACGVGQQGVAALSTLWIPAVIEENAARYGTIGVSFALLSWLVLISVVLVLAAALSVELGGDPPLRVAAGGAAGPLRTVAGLIGADDGQPAEPPDGQDRRPRAGGPGPGLPAPAGTDPGDATRTQSM